MISASHLDYKSTVTILFKGQRTECAFLIPQGRCRATPCDMAYLALILWTSGASREGKKNIGI